MSLNTVKCNNCNVVNNELLAGFVLTCLCDDVTVPYQRTACYCSRDEITWTGIEWGLDFDGARRRRYLLNQYVPNQPKSCESCKTESDTNSNSETIPLLNSDISEPPESKRGKTTKFIRSKLKIKSKLVRQNHELNAPARWASLREGNVSSEQIVGGEDIMGSEWKIVQINKIG